MEEMECEGKSVSEAVEAALRKLALRRDQVEVQILQEASSGFMGLGTKPARVKITQKHWGDSAPAAAAPARPALKPRSEPRAQPPAPARAQPERRKVPRPEPHPAPRPEPSAKSEPLKSVDPQTACRESEKLIKELLGLMEFTQASLSVAWDPQQERVKAVLDGPDAARLVSADGRPLESLQFISTLLLSRRLQTPAAVQVDALGHWQKREEDILSQARRGVEEVKRTGKSWRLSPMDAAMRRLIHRNLADHPDVETASEGEGAWRKIVLRPRRK